MDWRVTVGNERKEPLFTQAEAGVFIDLGSTLSTNELVLPMSRFIVKHAPLTILIQKETETAATTVYIRTADRYQFLIKNGYGMGYVGTGSRGLETLLEALTVNSADIQKLFEPRNRFIQLELK